MKIGQIVYASGDIVCNEGTNSTEIEVRNSGDRPIQVGSHYHFYEVNEALKFDRQKARGKRLDIIAGTAIRFEPGVVMSVRLIDLGGKRAVYGLNNKIDGNL